MKAFATAIALICSAAAGAGEPVKLESRFNIDEVQFVKRPGNSTVTGQAFLRMADGTYKDCAGLKIELLPVAAYSTERITRTYGNDHHGQILVEQDPPKFTPDVPEYHEMLLKGSCSVHGKFTFTDVPAGEYFVIALLVWDTATTPARKTGGAVMKRIHVAPKAQVSVLLKE